MVDERLDGLAAERSAEALATIDADIFDLAPVSLWLQDFSGLLALFAEWRAAGIEALGPYFAADHARVMECVNRVRTIKVNQHTIELYGASSEAELLASLAHIVGEDDVASVAGGFVHLWDGHRSFVRRAVNRSISGRPMNVLVTGTVLPGHEQSLDRVLVAVQDFTMQEVARRDLAESERYARGLFDHSPISLWVEDFSAVRRHMEVLRSQDIVDLRGFMASHEHFASLCLEAVRIVDVNDYTLRLFRAPDRLTLLSRLPEVLRDKVVETFEDQLVELWNGKLQQEREITSYALGGEELHLHMQLSIFPGHENDWSLVLVALTDISARKRAESYLEYLGTHDELTKLLNRAFYAAEIERLQRKQQFPISVIVIDLNGLKRINDDQGHMVGDEMLRRLGEVLDKAVDPPGRACRIGGDEFAILLPQTEAGAAESLLEAIRSLLFINNQFHVAAPLQIAAGFAMITTGERIEDAIRLADQRMYDEKARFYQAQDAQQTHRR
jgi:diguanylate cyclase (GGDEF)-like protein